MLYLSNDLTKENKTKRKIENDLAVLPSYNSEHTDATIEQTGDAMILMADIYMGVEDKVDGIAMVIDSGATDYYFTDFSAFTEYEKFNTPLTGRTAEKGTSFMIMGQETMKMAIEVENRRVVNLTL